MADLASLIGSDSTKTRPARDRSRTVMELVVDLVHPDHRLMFELLAATGVRCSEVLALQGNHLALDGDEPHIKVRLRCLTGHGLLVGPLNAKYGRRDLPISRDLMDRRRALRRGLDD